jgi:hypothetical protein
VPDARGNFKGQGWSKGREAGWERAFGAEMRAHDHDWPKMCPDCNVPLRFDFCPNCWQAFDV